MNSDILYTHTYRFTAKATVFLLVLWLMICWWQWGMSCMKEMHSGIHT